MPVQSTMPVPHLGVFNAIPASWEAQAGASDDRGSTVDYSGGSVAVPSSPRVLLRAVTPSAVPRIGRVHAAGPAHLTFSVRLPSYFKEPAAGEVDPLLCPIRIRLPDLRGAPWAQGDTISRLSEFVSCYGASGPWFSLSFLPPIAYWMPLSMGYECLHFRGLPLQVWVTGVLDDFIFDVDARSQCPILRIRVRFVLSCDQEAYRQLMNVIGGELDDAQFPQCAEGLCFFPHTTLLKDGLRDATGGYSATHLMPRLGLQEFHRGELNLLDCLIVRTVSDRGSDGGFLLVEEMSKISSCSGLPRPSARVGRSFAAGRRI